MSTNPGNAAARLPLQDLDLILAPHYLRQRQASRLALWCPMTVA